MLSLLLVFGIPRQTLALVDRNFENAARLLSQAATSLPSSNVPQTSQVSPHTNNVDRAQAEFRRSFSCVSRDRASTSSSSAARARSLSFTGRSRGKKRKPKEVMAKFFCLASKSQEEVPINEEKRELLVAGLGEKKCSLPENSRSAELHQVVTETFPKLLEGGGYEFLFAEPSSRHLKVISAGPDGYTMEYLKQFVGQGRVYIRPIQCNLDLDDANISTNIPVPGEFCQACYSHFPMNELRAHLEVCVPFDQTNTGSEVQHGNHNESINPSTLR